MSRAIAISLSPNAGAQDVILALRQIFSPWSWRNGPATALVEKWFKENLPVHDAIAFDSGRSSLFCVLKALGVGGGDEVLLQAYTCVAVPNAVLWTGARPRYVDIDPESFNIDVDDLEAKITPQTKAIIVQHTFGLPADLGKIQQIAERHGIPVIEDCAHALGAIYAERRVGTFGDAAIFSLGRDKVVSSVHGGVAVTNSPAIAEALREIQRTTSIPSRSWVLQQLLHPVAFSLIVPTYFRLSIGKVLLVLMQRARLLSLAVRPEEYKGRQPPIHPSGFANSLAVLALHQLGELDELNAHRKRLASLYAESLSGLPLELPPLNKGSVYLRYTVRTMEPERLLRAARKEGILLGDWYNSPIAPPMTDLAAVAYSPGECPEAERASRESVNLPTHRKVDRESAMRIVDFLRTQLRGPA